MCRTTGGRRVRLTQRTYDNHVPKHPEVAEYLEEAQQVIADPDGVIELTSNARLLYAYGLGRDRYKNCYLGVVVYYRRQGDSETGVVATYYFHRTLPKGRVLATRHEWVYGERIAVHGLAGGKEGTDG